MNKFFDFDDDIDINFDEQLDILKVTKTEKKKKSKEQNKNVKNLFSHLDAIYRKPYDPEYFDKLDESSKKTFSTFMINRFLSMHTSWIEIVNYAQSLIPYMSNKEVYKFYATIFDDKNEVRFLSYVKNKRENKFDKELVDIVSIYYEVSKKEAIEYLEVLFVINGGKETLKEICASYGYEEKEIKKMIK